MPVSSHYLSQINTVIGQAVRYEDLARRNWSRQTNLVRLVFAVAAMCADHGTKLWLVDGRISTDVIKKALSTGDVRNYFNRRFHDLGLDWQRLLVFEVKGPVEKGLHFHGFIALPENMTKKTASKHLKKIFGDAGSLRHNQLDWAQPDLSQGHLHGAATGKGAVGKLFYALRNAGSTFAALDLHRGGRKLRTASAYQRRINANGERLAKPIGSNFAKQIVLCDRLTQQRGQRAFEGWVQATRDAGKGVPARVKGSVNTATFKSGILQSCKCSTLAA